MNSITVSAPGKLMLFGEHAVVYGYPCIVTAVDQRLFLTVKKVKVNQFQLAAKDVGVTNYKKPLDQIGKGDIPKGAMFIEMAIKNFLFSHPACPPLAGTSEESKFEFGIKISTKSDFSSLFGFGSSSAATVCTIKALSELFEIRLTKKEIFEISYKTVLDIQKTGSGVDVAAAVFGGTLSFVIDGKIIESLSSNALPLIVGYSGIKADTVTVLTVVKEKTKKYPIVINGVYKEIAKLILLAKTAITASDYETLGYLMNFNQGYLESLGVSTEKLSRMIYAARDAGAYGAKLSGAGGGDCMIAITRENGKEKRPARNASENVAGGVKKAIEKAGGKIIDVRTNAEGVRREV